MNKKITIVSNLYYPDELGGAALVTDLAAYLSEKGYCVNVVTTFPYYPQWVLRESDRRCLERFETINGIPVQRLRMHIPKKASTWGRLMADWSFTIVLLLFGRRNWKNSDLVITLCPMMGQMLAVRLSSPFGSQKRMAIVQDFVVDAAMELGMLKGLYVGNVLRRIERWIFGGFNTLTTISVEMHQKLKTVASPKSRTQYVPNWIHSSLMKAIDAASAVPVKRARGLLFYSGNVGRKQGLPFFIQSFQGTDKGWMLKIHGGGAEYERLLKACGERQDIVLGPVISEADYIQALRSCSACLITQMPGVGANFLPSKILPALACGTPILAVCESQSPLGREVINSQCGEIIEPGHHDSVSATLDRWMKDPSILERYSANAKAWASRYHRDAILSLFREEVDALIESRASRPPFAPYSSTADK